MSLILSYVAARERATGRVAMLAFAASVAGGGKGNAEVGKAYADFLAPKSGELRAKYSHILFVIDNNVRSAHEFPDPAHAAREHLREQIKAAKSDHARAVRAAEQAQALAKDARLAAKTVDDHAARIAELEERHDAIQPLPSAPFVVDAPPILPQPTPKTTEPTPEEALGQLNDDDLAKVAETYGIAPAEGATRDDLIAAILKKSSSTEP